MTRQYLSITNIFIALCAVAYFISTQVSDEVLNNYRLFYFESSMFQAIQILTHMFLHGSPTHLLFNMIGLFMFGNTVEKILGKNRYLMFYILCGLGAAAIYLSYNYYLLHSLLEPLIASGVSQIEVFEAFENRRYFSNFPNSKEAGIIFLSPVIGASGVVYGILVAFACLFPNNKIMLIFLPVPIPAKFFVPALLALDVFSEYTGFALFNQNVAHAAHIGGAITGFILFLVMRYQIKKTSRF